MNSYKKTPLPLLSFVLAASLTLVTLGACAPRLDTRGNQVLLEDVATIEPGTHTRRNVMEKLGSPSSTSPFGVETWYYISERTETTAFLAPEIMDRQVVVIQFDVSGVVTKVNTIDTEQAELVEPVPGETPTAGNSLTFFQQMISNLGRFNKNKK